MIRKLCDKMGIFVWQDMPNVDTASPRDDFKKHTKASSDQFERELKLMIDNKYNHPCILTWILFNEGMGQYGTKRLAKWINDYDTTRTVNATSGWNDKATDANDFTQAYKNMLENLRSLVEYPGLSAA